MSETTVGTASVTTSDGLEVTSSSATPEEMKANFDAENDGKEGEADPVKKAASELGKRGGEAAAEARKVRERDAKKAAKEAEGEIDEEPAKEPEKEPEAKEPEVKRPNPRHDARARIEQLAREKRELADRVARLEAAQKPKEAPAAEKPAEDEPTPDQFETYELFTKEQARVEARREAKALYESILKENREKERAEAERQHAEAQAARNVERVKTLYKRIEEGAQVVRDEETGEITALEASGKRVDPRFLMLEPTWSLSPDRAPGPLNDIAAMLLDSEQTLPLMVYLTEHEDEMEALTKVGAGKSRDEGIQAIGRYIGRLERALEMGTPAPAVPATPREAPRPAVSQARPPVTPLPASAVPGEEDIDAIDDFDLYAAKANAREAQKRRAGR